MVFKRRRYKLPKFPPDVIPAFKSLCRAVPDAEIPAIRKALDEQVDELIRQAQTNELINLPIVQALAERSRLLLEHYAEFKPQEKALIMGAIYYFALEEDSSPDTGFASGFDDDVAVMNHVLEELNVENQFIEIRQDTP